MADEKPSQPSKADPLHGVTLAMVVTQLVEYYGWQRLGQEIKIKCFTHEPSMASSLKFLRRTPWARAKVEALYLATSFHAPLKRTAAEAIWANRNKS